MEKLDDGRKIFLSMKMEEKKMKEFEENKSAKLEFLYQKAEKDCENLIAKEGWLMKSAAPCLYICFTCSSDIGGNIYNVNFTCILCSVIFYLYSTLLGKQLGSVEY